MKRITKNIYQYEADGCVYFLELEKKIIIDTSSRHNKRKLIESLKINAEDVDIVIFTHLHQDHTGNFDLFTKAKFYASSEAIEDLNKNAYGAVLNQEIADRLLKIKINKLPDKLFGLRVIKTPGHTRGSVCLLFGDVLFSGDTLFFNDNIGRSDLPTSVPEKMSDSLDKLKKVDYKILCPGHDYQ